MAVALALPADFPSRDVIQLCALAVVGGTLVVQGLTLGPLLRWLDFPPDGMGDRVEKARVKLLDAARDALSSKSDRSAEILREVYASERDLARDGKHPREVSEMDEYRRAAVTAKRHKLVQLRNDDEIDDDVFHTLYKNSIGRNSPRPSPTTRNSWRGERNYGLLLPAATSEGTLWAEPCWIMCCLR